MNTFKIIRLVLWGGLIAVCIVIVGFYLALQQTFLAGDGLKNIIRESHVTATVRDDVLLPKILQATRSSDYSTLLDDQTVTDSFNHVASIDTLNTKLDPVAESVQKWLNSKEPSISFSVSMNDVSNDFADELANRVNAKIARLPACTARNTLTQAEMGICRSSFISSAAISKTINEIIKSDDALAANTTITPESITIPNSAVRVGSDLPSYLNLLYATAIMAAAYSILAALWLLIKHRLAGIITLGASAVFGAIGLFIVSVVSSHAVSAFASSDPLLQQAARTGSTLFESAIQQQVILLAAGGSATVVVGIIALLFLKRRRRSNGTAVELTKKI